MKPTAYFPWHAMLWIGLCLICTHCTSRHTLTIHAVGDSTMAPKEPHRRPETGWVECMPTLMSPDVTLHNHAVNGRSTRSFMSEGRWYKVVEQLRAGDYVLIQFGHNDAKRTDSVRFSNAGTQYRANLLTMIADTKAKGAIPVLLTPVVRRQFNANGVLEDTHGAYPETMRSVAHETGTLLLDAQLWSEQLVQAYGPERSAELFLHLPPGKEANFPDGVADDTHLNANGAARVAAVVLREWALKDVHLALFVPRVP